MTGICWPSIHALPLPRIVAATPGYEVVHGFKGRKNGANSGPQSGEPPAHVRKFRPVMPLKNRMTVKTAPARAKKNNSAKPKASMPLRLGGLDEALGFRVRVLDQVVTRSFARHMTFLGLTPTLYSILVLDRKSVV